MSSQQQHKSTLYQFEPFPMSKKQFQNLQSIQGISGIGFNELDLSMGSNNLDSARNNQYTIKINAPQGQFSPTYAYSEKQLDQDTKKITTKNAYSPDNTGYDINRELFSDEDIREAFNTIDINNNGCITTDELSFFLKCMNQPHTTAEVQEMIKMISNDGTRVMIEDFKKIGRGKLPPFAAIRQPEAEAVTKQEVLDNYRESSILVIDPLDLLEFKNQLELSHEAFQSEKSRKQDFEDIILEPLIEQNGGMKLRTSQEIKAKREEYNRVLMLNVDKAIEALKHVKQDVLELHELADVLSISEQEARILFEKARLTVRQVIFDVILFSQGNNLKKMELVLNYYGQGVTLELEEWVDVLCFMMGINEKNFIKKRLENLLRHKKIQLNASFDRYFILQLMTEEYALFLW